MIYHADELKFRLKYELFDILPNFHNLRVQLSKKICAALRPMYFVEDKTNGLFENESFVFPVVVLF